MTVAVMRRAVAAITLIDILDHFFAPFMLEIDVDIRRFVALLGDETLEEQIEFRWIDSGDAEHDSKRPNWRPSRGPGRECLSRLAKRTMSWTVRK